MLAFDRWSEWMDGWKNAEYISEVHSPEDKYRVGALAHITELNIKYDFEIMESLKNEKITFSSKHYTLSYILSPAEEETGLTYAIDYEPPWGILGKGLAKLFRGQGEKGVEKELKKLKSILEK